MSSLAIFLFRSTCKGIIEKGLTELIDGQGFGSRIQDVSWRIFEHFQNETIEYSHRDILEQVASLSIENSSLLSQIALNEINKDPLFYKKLSRQKYEDRLLAYLEQLPSAVRKHFRRPSDPLGISPPKDYRITKPEELMVLLPPKAPRFRVGEIPIEDLRLKELLGIGAFGEVWKAEKLSDPKGQTVALKFCLTSDSVRYLRHETGLLQRIVKQVGEKKGIVQLRRAWLEADPPCLEYEFVNGGDLCGLMAEWLNLTSEKRTKLALQMLHRLSKTISSLHDMNPPIVHRDLKPANVLVARGAGRKIDLKISDFGIGGLAAGKALEGQTSGFSQAEILTQTLRGSHTPIYAGPEQQAGAAPHPSDDVHALGVIGFQLLACDLRRGPSGDWDDELRERGASLETIKVLRRCLSRQSRRFQNAGELQRALEEVLKENEDQIESETSMLKPLPFDTTRNPHSIKPENNFFGGDDGWNTKVPGRKAGLKNNLETLLSNENQAPSLDPKKNKCVNEGPLPKIIPLANPNQKKKKKEPEKLKGNWLFLVLGTIIAFAGLASGIIIVYFYKSKPESKISNPLHAIINQTVIEKKELVVDSGNNIKDSEKKIEPEMFQKSDLPKSTQPNLETEKRKDEPTPIKPPFKYDNLIYRFSDLVQIPSTDDTLPKSIEFSSDLSFLAKRYDRNTITVWSIKERREVNKIQRLSAFVEYCKFSENGSLIAAVLGDNSIKLCRVATEDPILDLDQHGEAITNICFSRDGKFLASTYSDGLARVFDTSTGRIIKTFQANPDIGLTSNFSPNGSFLATGGPNNHIMLWELTSGLQAKTVEGSPNKITSLCFSNDGNFLACTCLDNSAIIWNLYTGKPSMTLKGNNSVLFGSQFGLINKRLVSRCRYSDGSNGIMIWDLEKQIPIKSIVGNPLSLNSDSGILAFGSSDFSVTLLDITNGNELQVLKKHSAKIATIKISNDLKTIATHGLDTQINLWSAGPRE